LQISPNQELMMISSNGTLVRTPVSDVSVQGRNTQGVRLIRLDAGERLTGVEGVQSLGDEGGLPPGENLPGESQGDQPTPN
jgi:DNA gyrase subunit A